jgi:hypothetical protein
MDVRELAPSLLALADVFDIATQAAGPSYLQPPALEVRAISEGSFIVDLLLAAQDPAEATFEWAKSPDGAATGTLLTIATAALAAINWAVTRRRKGPEEAVTPIDPGTIRIVWPDGTQFEAPMAAKDLAANMDFNRAAGAAFEPLRRDGIDAIEFGRIDDDEASVRLLRDDLGAFNTLEPDEDLLSDNTRTVTVRLTNLAFKEGNKWRVNDGASTFWASVHDLKFLQRVTSNEELFARDDTLRVRMRDQQFRSGAGTIRMEHQIEEVLEHRRASAPETLPFDDSPER